MSTTSRTAPEPGLVTHFKEWLRKHRGASDSTIRLYARDAAQLMAALGDEPGGWEPAAIRGFFLDCASRCGNRQEFGLAVFEPLSRRCGLTLRAVAVATGNGRRPLPALWALPVMGSRRRLERAFAFAAANPALHYEERLRSSISLSDGWKAPRRKCGGTIDSMASSFSVGSPRV